MYVHSSFHYSNQTPISSDDASKAKEKFASQSTLASPEASTEGTKFAQASAGFSFEATRSGAGGAGSKPTDSGNTFIFFILLMNYI